VFLTFLVQSIMASVTMPLVGAIVVALLTFAAVWLL
jgi:hypothetical protein